MPKPMPADDLSEYCSSEWPRFVVMSEAFASTLGVVMPMSDVMKRNVTNEVLNIVFLMPFSPGPA